jgi:hypothetical protein
MEMGIQLIVVLNLCFLILIEGEVCLPYCTFFAGHLQFANRLYKDAILFEQNGNIGNISRTSPSLVSTGDGGKPYFHMLGAGAKAMMFTSVVLVKQSFLEEPKISGNGKLFKVIDGALLAGEYERFVGAVGMIIREQEFKSQLYLDNLSFTTAFASSDNSMSLSFDFDHLC